MVRDTIKKNAITAHLLGSGHSEQRLRAAGWSLFCCPDKACALRVRRSFDKNEDLSKVAGLALSALSKDGWHGPCCFLSSKAMVRGIRGAHVKSVDDFRLLSSCLHLSKRSNASASGGASQLLFCFFSRCLGAGDTGDALRRVTTAGEPLGGW